MKEKFQDHFFHLLHACHRRMSAFVDCNCTFWTLMNFFPIEMNRWLNLNHLNLSGINYKIVVIMSDVDVIWTLELEFQRPDINVPHDGEELMNDDTYMRYLLKTFYSKWEDTSDVCYEPNKSFFLFSFLFHGLQEWMVDNDDNNNRQ